MAASQCWPNSRVRETKSGPQRFCMQMGRERVIRGYADLTVWMSTPPTHSFLFLLISCHHFPFGGEFFPSLSPLLFTLRLSICKQMHAYVSIITSAHSQTSHHHIKALIRNMCPGWRLLRSPKLIPSAEKLMNNKNEKVLILFPQSCQQMWGEKNATPHHLNFSPQRVSRLCRITGNYMLN